MVKYICIREYNDWEGASHLMFIPYNVNLQNMVKVEILKTVIKKLNVLDEDCDFAIREMSYTKEEVINAITIMEDTFDDYFSAMNILEKDILSKLITIFIQIYYELLEIKDGYSIQETKSYHLIYKGNIMKL